MSITKKLRHSSVQHEPDEPTEVLLGKPAFVPPLQVPVVPRIPGYEIIRLLDQGGMSNIYLAIQKNLNREVAIKMIRSEFCLDHQARNRFVLEASSIASLHHPNVVQIFEIGEAEGLPYLCLEYVPGGNLERMIKESLPSARAAAQIVMQLADAVTAAHERQIIHRDLKPANVLCDYSKRSSSETIHSHANASSSDTAFNVKIADFGLARILCESSDQTKSGYAIGTPSFMSPEQASGHPEEIGKSTDIYGLGAILYELLTGQPPFHGCTALDTIQKVRFDAPTPPSYLVRSVPRALESICLQCLQKEPENRYPTAKALAADLRRFLNGQSVTAHPVSPIRRWFRQSRRKPFRTLAYLSIPILATLAGVVLFLLSRTSDHLKKKELELEHARDELPSQPETGLAPAGLPAQVQQALDHMRHDPGKIEHVNALINLGNDWVGRIERDFPADFAVQFGVGNVYLRTDRHEQALACFERAQHIAEDQSRIKAGDTGPWVNLALVHERIGDIHVLQMDGPSALRNYQRNLSIFEMLHQDDPRQRRWALDLAAACRKIADFYAEESDWPTAVLYTDRRIGLLAKLQPEMLTLNPEIRAAHLRMAEFHQKIGNKAAEKSHLHAAEKWAAETP